MFHFYTPEGFLMFSRGMYRSGTLVENGLIFQPVQGSCHFIYLPPISMQLTLLSNRSQIIIQIKILSNLSFRCTSLKRNKHCLGSLIFVVSLNLFVKIIAEFFKTKFSKSSRIYYLEFLATCNKLLKKQPSFKTDIIIPLLQ